MMKQDLKNNELRERQGYASPSVEVTESAELGVLCESTRNSPEQYDTEEW